jgi:hypothetical protein
MPKGGQDVDINIRLAIVAGFLVVVKDLIAKVAWSFLLYFSRKEFDLDKNDDTPDKFLLLNPYLGTFQKCYITQYTVTGVRWGFFIEEGYVSKFSYWLAWADSRELRFPMAMKTTNSEQDSIVFLIKKR